MGKKFYRGEEGDRKGGTGGVREKCVKRKNREEYSPRKDRAKCLWKPSSSLGPGRAKQGQTRS